MENGRGTKEDQVRSYHGISATGRQAARPMCAAVIRPAGMPSLRLDEAVEGTSRLFGSHQWKPNAVLEPPV